MTRIKEPLKTPSEQKSGLVVHAFWASYPGRTTWNGVELGKLSAGRTTGRPEPWAGTRRAARGTGTGAAGMQENAEAELTELGRQRGEGRATED